LPQVIMYPNPAKEYVNFKGLLLKWANPVVDCHNRK